MSICSYEGNINGRIYISTCPDIWFLIIFLYGVKIKYRLPGFDRVIPFKYKVYEPRIYLSTVNNNNGLKDYDCKLITSMGLNDPNEWDWLM